MSEPKTQLNPVIHTILLVDDDATILMFLDRVLRSSGYHILKTLSPDEVFGILESEHVDILISDIDMPFMSGIELVSKVRELFPDIVRILLTGQSSLDTAIKAINEGEVFRYLFKPVDEESLLRVINEATVKLAELRKTSSVTQIESKRQKLLQALEEVYPGICDFSLQDGIYSLEKDKLETLISQLDPSFQQLFISSQKD